MRLRGQAISKFFASLLKYLTAAVFIYIPLYPKFPLFFVPGSSVAVRAEDFLIAATSVVLLIHFLLTKKKTLPPLALNVIVYLIVGAVSAISAIMITKNVAPIIVLLHLARRLEYILVFFFAFYVGREGIASRRFLFELVLLPAIGVFFYGLAQIYLSAPVISTMNKEFAKGIALMLAPGVQLSSTFAGHYDLAIYLAMIAAFLAALMTFAKRGYQQILLLISYVALMWLFTQAGSRIAIFGLIFCVVLICGLRRKFKLALLLSVIVGVSIFTSPGLLMRLNNLIRVIQAQISSVVVPTVHAAEGGLFNILGEETLRPIQEDRSTSIRFDVEWPRAMRSLYKNPFLGTGFSSISLATDNEYLRSLGETGILGFLAFLAVLIALGRLLIYRYRDAKTDLDKVITLGGLGVYSVFLISAIFLDVFEASKIATLFWAFTGLAVSTKS